MVSKKKSSNPLDAHRKAARARELKKNREKRKETREVTLVKKDTRGIEKEIRFLQGKKSLSATEKEELESLQGELERIKEAKEEYLAKNPEHRKFVYPREAEEQAEQARREQSAKEANVNRRPQRDPKRSVYYHEVFNPHGAPPPGMPYMEKSAEQWEAEQRKQFDSLAGEGSEGDGEVESGDDDSEGEGNSEDDDDDDDEIMLPEGPPPPKPTSVQLEAGEEVDDDSSKDEDGIVMPKGPPPGPPSAPRAMKEGILVGPSAMQRPSTQFRPPLPTMPFPGRPVSYPTPPMRPIRPPPQRPFMHGSGQFTPHPPAMTTGPTSYQPISRPPPAPTPGPPPPRPPTVITSAPVLRDLKKEATAFVPTALRKKQAVQKAKAAKGGLPSAVNAAPDAGDASPTNQSVGRGDEQEELELEERVDLMASLKPHFGTKVAAEGNADYKKFLNEMNDLL